MSKMTFFDKLLNSYLCFNYLYILHKTDHTYLSEQFDGVYTSIQPHLFLMHILTQRR